MVESIVKTIAGYSWLDWIINGTVVVESIVKTIAGYSWLDWIINVTVVVECIVKTKAGYRLNYKCNCCDREYCKDYSWL